MQDYANLQPLPKPHPLSLVAAQLQRLDVQPSSSASLQHWQQVIRAQLKASRQHKSVLPPPQQPLWLPHTAPHHLVIVQRLTGR